MGFSLFLAQSASEAANETAQQTKELLAKITTWKIAQALIILVVSFVVIKIIDKLVILDIGTSS